MLKQDEIDWATDEQIEAFARGSQEVVDAEVLKKDGNKKIADEGIDWATDQEVREFSSQLEDEGIIDKQETDEEDEGEFELWATDEEAEEFIREAMEI